MKTVKWNALLLSLFCISLFARAELNQKAQREIQEQKEKFQNFYERRADKVLRNRKRLAAAKKVRAIREAERKRREEARLSYLERREKKKDLSDLKRRHEEKVKKQEEKRALLREKYIKDRNRLRDLKSRKGKRVPPEDEIDLYVEEEPRLPL